MEVLDYSITLGKRDRDYEVKEAARMGIESARRLLQSLTHAQPAVVDEECDTIATAAISKFQKVVSLLGRTGHARFRRRARDSTVTGCAGVFLESSNFFTDNAQVLEPRDRPVSSGHASPSPSPFTPIASSKPPQSPELQRILYQVCPSHLDPCKLGRLKVSPATGSLKASDHLRSFADDLISGGMSFFYWSGISSKLPYFSWRGIRPERFNPQYTPPHAESSPPSA